MKERENDVITEATAMGFFTRYLDDIKWKYHYSKDRRYLFSGINGDGLMWDFSMFARAQADDMYLLGVNSFIPTKVPPQRVAACAELLTRINSALSLGCFELYYDQCEIRFRTSITLPGTDITPAIIRQLVRSNLGIVEDRFADIAAVLFAKMPPAEAMKPKAAAPASKPEPRFDLN